MATKLNKKAFEYAKRLISDGSFEHDERDDWSEHAATADEENHFIETNGYQEYEKWHLGIDEDASEEIKGRYSFPFGDFEKVHRCGVISIESRASQNDYGDIRKAAGELMELMEK